MAQSYNKVILAGRLTRDPELRYTSSGTPVTTFTLAVDRRQKEKETDFFNITAWDKLADTCDKYLAKGHLVLIEGSLRTRTYEKDGQKRYITEVLARDLTLLESRRTDSADSAGYSTDKGKTDKGKADLEDEVPIDLEEMPF